MKLDSPKLVKKPVTMKWCTFPDGSQAPVQAQGSAFDLNLINGPPNSRLPRPFEAARTKRNSTAEEK